MIIFLYIIKDYFKYVIGTIIMCIFLFILFDFIHKSTYYLAKYNPSSKDLSLFYFYQIPNLVIQGLPIAALLASVICMVLLSRTNEITAMRAIGMGPMQIGAPVAVGGAVLCVISALIGEVILPRSAQKMHYIQNVLMEKSSDLPAAEGARWLHNNNLFYSFKDYDVSTQDLIDVRVIKLGDPFRPRKTMLAQRAVFQRDINAWKLLDVKTFYFWPNGTLSYAESHQSVIVQIPIDPGKLVTERRLPAELSIKELTADIERNQSHGSDVLSTYVELHTKLAFYFASFVVSLIGLKFGYRSERSMETARGVLLAIAIGVSYWFILNTAKALGKRGTLNPIFAAWAANCAIIMFSWISIVRSRKKG